MQEHRIVCDSCGRPLQHHGKRYVVKISEMPMLRLVRNDVTYDLCQTCAARLKVKLGRGSTDG